MKKSMRTASVGVGLAAMLVAGTGAAYASHTAVSVNGNKTVGNVAYTAANDTSSIKFTTNYGVEMGCTTAAITGAGSVIKRGTSVAVGNTVAQIGALSFSGCVMAGVFPLAVTMTGGNINVRTHPVNANDEVPVTITGISAHIASTSPSLPCAFDADGTLAAVIKPGSVASGKDATIELVSATFDSSGNPVSGFDLDISGVSGCGGEVQNGDEAGSYFATGTTRSAFVVDTTGLVTHN